MGSGSSRVVPDDVIKITLRDLVDLYDPHHIHESAFDYDYLIKKQTEYINNANDDASEKNKRRSEVNYDNKNQKQAH